MQNFNNQLINQKTSNLNDGNQTNNLTNSIDSQKISDFIDKHLLDNLYDIEDLFEINIWPLAIGWWFVIGFVILGLIGALVFYLRSLALKKTWKYQVRCELIDIKSNISKKNAYKYLMRISEILRMIAYHQNGIICNLNKDTLSRKIQSGKVNLQKMNKQEKDQQAVDLQNLSLQTTYLLRENKIANGAKRVSTKTNITLNVSLYGESWINWLNQNAPKSGTLKSDGQKSLTQFDWATVATVINEIPYMPEDTIKNLDVDITNLKQMIDIMIQWVGVKG